MLQETLRSLVFRKKRRTGPRIFGIGAAKTGTHSLAAMFEDHVPAMHEADCLHLIRLILESEQSGVDVPLTKFLAAQDKNRRLKINASQLNIYLVDHLRRLFPDSKFVQTLRHPLEWLRSMLDDSLRRDVEDSWHKFRDFRFGPRDNLPPQEQALANAGLYSLSGYLGYWRTATTVAKEKLGDAPLFVVKTEMLGERSRELAEFCEVANYTPNTEKTHAFANTARFGLLGQLDRDYVIATTEAVCGDLLREYYPESSTGDVLDEIVARDRRAASC